MYQPGIGYNESINLKRYLKRKTKSKNSVIDETLLKISSELI